MYRLLPIAFLGFVVLGMPGAAVGVAWPSMAGELGQTLGGLGWLIAVHIAGYFIASISNGDVTRRLGTGRALVVSGVLGSVALTAYAVTPNWGFLLSAAFVSGVAGGMIDAVMNAHVALTHSSRVMGFLHASFGVGATLGPLMMTWLITAGRPGWRWGFAVLAVVQLAATVAFWRTRRDWGGGDALSIRPSRSGLRTVVPLLGAFLLVAGIESGTGAWAFTFLTEELGLADGSAGILVSVFFACFTLGRVAMGVLGDRIAARTYLQVGASAALMGLGLLWWSPSPWIAGAGLIATGVGVSPLFPILMVVTPQIVGPEHANDVVGYELGAATLGAAVIPASIGVAVDGFGTQMIPTVLVVAAVAQLLFTAGRAPS